VTSGNAVVTSCSLGQQALPADRRHGSAAGRQSDAGQPDRDRWDSALFLSAQRRLHETAIDQHPRPVELVGPTQLGQEEFVDLLPQSQLRPRFQATLARLARRGLTLSAGFFAAVLTEEIASAAPSAALADSTTKAAMQFAAGKAATAGALSAKAAALTTEVLRAMFLAKLKTGRVPTRRCRSRQFREVHVDIAQACLPQRTVK
jgi:hypothetical protein